MDNSTDELTQDILEDLLLIKIDGNYAGYKSNFFNFENSRASLSQLFTCLICGGVFVDPLQIHDCGHIFCKSCINNLEECPLDQIIIQKDTLYRDKFIEAKINEMEIKCPLYSRGCSWTGPLVSGRDHLETCGFVNVKCRLGCEKIMMRKILDSHEIDECGFFKIICEFCKETCKRIHMEEHRTLNCTDFPIKCPNACHVDAIPRSQIPIHLEEECPLSLVRCCYESLGCQALVERQNVRDHMQNDQMLHLQLVTDKVRDLTTVVDTIANENEKLTETVANLDANLEEANALLSSQKNNMEKRLLAEDSNAVNGQFIWKITNVKEKIKKNIILFSKPFYTSVKGYKFCIQMYMNGNSGGKCNHVSVYLYLQRGNYDSELEWPFRGTVKFTLLNQVGDSDHYIVSSFNTEENEKKFMSSEQGVNNSGYGYPKFISHSKLLTEKSKYYRDNCLYLKIDIQPKYLLHHFVS